MESDYGKPVVACWHCVRRGYYNSTSGWRWYYYWWRGDHDATGQR
jgi:hypothetical protein